jgi:type IV pilus assembly protein PilB
LLRFGIILLLQFEAEGYTIKVMSDIQQSPSVTQSSSPQQGSLQQNSGQDAPFDIRDAKSVLDILYADHALTKQQYDEVKVKSATDDLSPAEVLKSMNIIPEEKIAEALAQMVGIPYISLSSVSFSPQAIGLLPKAVVDRFLLIPFSYEEKTKTLSIAMSNPIDLDAIAFVRQKTGLNVKSFAAAPREVTNAIEQQYRQELVGEVGAAIKESEEFKNRTVDSKQIAEIISDAPIAKIVSTILEYAMNSRSSDVHIEPLEDKVRVRYRIDGILYDKLSLPKNVQDALTSRIKISRWIKMKLISVSQFFRQCKVKRLP